MISLRNSSKALDSRKTAVCTHLYPFLSRPVPSRIGSQLKTGQIYTNQPTQMGRKSDGHTRKTGGAQP